MGITSSGRGPRGLVQGGLFEVSPPLLESHKVFIPCWIGLDLWAKVLIYRACTCKVFIILGLGAETRTPRVVPRGSFASTSIVAKWGGERCQVYLVWNELVRWVWGLTVDSSLVWLLDDEG